MEGIEQGYSSEILLRELEGRLPNKPRGREGVSIRGLYDLAYARIDLNIDEQIMLARVLLENEEAITKKLADAWKLDAGGEKQRAMILLESVRDSIKSRLEP